VEARRAIDAPSARAVVGAAGLDESPEGDPAPRTEGRSDGCDARPAAPAESRTVHAGKGSAATGTVGREQCLDHRADQLAPQVSRDRAGERMNAWADGG